MPPPPENFTDDWGMQNGLPSQQSEGISETILEEPPMVQVEPEDVSQAVEEPASIPEPNGETSQASRPLISAAEEPVAGLSAPQPERSGKPTPDLPPVPPRRPKKADLSEGAEKLGPPQMVTIVLRSTGDKDRDILRMRRIYGVLISSPGNDRFAFYMIERNQGYRLEFPSDSTEFSSGLRAALEDIVGVGNVIVEPITYL